MDPTAVTPGDEQAATRRCVILASPTGQPTDRLAAGLEKRQVRPTRVDAAPEVMIALAETDAVALIVAEPSRHGHLAELLRAVRRYYPRTLCWQYDPAGAGLVPIEAEPEQPAQPRRPRRTDADRWRELLSDSQPELAPQQTAPPELTAQELDMLLGREPDSLSPEEVSLEDERR